jgi:hypothetical protein
MRCCAATWQLIGAVVMTALIAGAIALGAAPAWVAVVVASTFAVLLALRWWADRRRGRRWF